MAANKYLDRCFVAMAFGHKDTDQLYKNTIDRVLREHKVAPIRLDRIQHNDDINKRMLQEIDSASFALADLTYARPSVYYEAGFAERKIPVIYTARSDHFHRDAGGESDTPRIHFDLRMKNIIRWKAPTDRLFSAALSRRIKDLITVLRKPVLISQSQEDEKREFQSLSVDARRDLIFETCTAALEASGYELTSGDAGTRVCNFVRTTKQIIHNVEVRVAKSTGTADAMISSSDPDYDLNSNETLATLCELRETQVLCSLSPIRFDDLCNDNPEFRPDHQRKSLYFDSKFDVPVFPSGELGPVFLEYRATLFGKQTTRGFAVRYAPSSISSTSSARNGFRFAKVPSRSVKRRIRFRLFDNIESAPAFETSFRKFLQQPF